MARSALPPNPSPVPCTCSSSPYSSLPACSSARSAITQGGRAERRRRLERPPRSYRRRRDRAFNPPFGGPVHSRGGRGSIGIAAARKQQEQRCRPLPREIGGSGRNIPRATPQSRPLGSGGSARAESIGDPHCPVPAPGKVIITPNDCGLLTRRAILHSSNNVIMGISTIRRGINFGNESKVSLKYKNFKTPTIEAAKSFCSIFRNRSAVNNT